MLGHTQDIAGEDSGCLRGVRFQLFMALRAMGAGEPLIVYVSTPPGRPKRPVPLHVSGTLAEDTIGHLLIDRGWCSQSPKTHWIPSLQVFEINATGRESLEQARLWWRELSWWQRLKVMLFE